MAFGPESTNPRERRAFAHAVIKRFQEGTATYTDAHEAAQKANKTSKGARSGFEGAIGPIVISGITSDYRNNKTIISGVSKGLAETAKALQENGHMFSMSMNAYVERPGTDNSELPAVGQELQDPTTQGFVPMSNMPHHTLGAFNPSVDEATHTNNYGATFYKSVPVRPEHVA